MPQLSAATSSLDECVTGISSWVTSHRFKVNESKIEVMVIGTKIKAKTANIKFVKVYGEEISVAKKVRSLEVVIDSIWSMDVHVSHRKGKKKVT